MDKVNRLSSQIDVAERRSQAMKTKYTPDQIERMQTKMALSEGGLFAAFGAVKWKWLDEKIMEQPCYVSPFTIKDEVTMSADVTGKARPQTVSGATKIIKGIGTFIRFNPFFTWKDLKTEEWVWAGSRGKLSASLFGLAKFFFCITLKGFASPLLLLFYALKFFVIFIYALKLPEFFTAVAGTFYNPFSGANKITIPYFRCTYDGDLAEPNCDHLPEPKPVMPFFDMVLVYLGMILPLHMIVGKGYGKTYGQGGLSVLIIVFALISAALIIVTGCNIVVMFGVVTFFIFRSAVGFYKVTTGKDIQGGKTS